MSFWTWLNGTGPIIPNDGGPSNVNPGDPDGFELQGQETFSRSLPFPTPSPWSGWPAEWDSPNWSASGLTKLIDCAWGCLDLNSSILSSMPVYQIRGGEIMDPEMWMMNPDPMVYNNWNEFAKQLFWDYQLGEAFVLPMAYYDDGKPRYFRVIPPWLINVEMRGGGRTYQLGNQDVTDEILHIRYQSNTTDAHGHGPLEMAGARMTLVGLLQKYAQHLTETGGTPLYWIGLERKISPTEGQDLLASWIESRTANAGYPAILGGGSTLNQANSMSARDLTLLELSHFNESRIAVLLGVPPFLVGLPGAAGSLTYSNVESLFDFHDRSSLRPKANAVMSALSQWALPAGRSAELNRDDYTRPELSVRAAAYKILIEAGVLTAEEVRAMERFTGRPAAVALTGGAD